MGEWIAWLAGAGLILAAAGWLLWRSERTRASALESDQAASQARLAKLESELERERKARQKQGGELSELRKRADKVRRRGSKPGTKPLGTAARISDLEAQLEKARAERDRVERERDSTATELEAARREVRSAAQAAERAQSKPQVAEIVPEPENTRSDETASLQKQLAEAKERLAKLESEHEIARQTEVRIRKRMQNQEMLYASVRSELEVKKDRLRTQEEQIQRLQALKVAVLEEPRAAEPEPPARSDPAAEA